MSNRRFIKTLSIIAACAVCASSVSTFVVGASDNIITSNTFEEGTSGWKMFTENGGGGSLSNAEGRLAIDVFYTGYSSEAVQSVYESPIVLQNGATYKLSYDISSTLDRTVDVIIEQSGVEPTVYGTSSVSANGTVQHVEQTFKMTSPTDTAARLVINCGNQSGDMINHKIFIDNIVIECVDSGETENNSRTAVVPVGDRGIILNQVGYRTAQSKKAVFRGVTEETVFSVVNAETGDVVYTGELTNEQYDGNAGEVDYQGDFSEVTEPGTYYIICGSMPESYTFTIDDSVYDGLLEDTVHMLYLQRCGTEVHDGTFGHSACHTDLAKVYGTEDYIDVSSGWHDAGDYGRYVTSAAKTVADLLLAYDAAPSAFGDSTGIPESGNGVADILDEARYELEWMLKMQSSDGGVYHKVSTKKFPGWIMPEEDTKQLIVAPVSTMATADFCASMAMAYEFYKDIDGNFAASCLSAAEKAWGYLEANPNLVFEDTNGGTDYADRSDYDERYWAAAQMYRATGELKYSKKFRGMNRNTGLGWQNVSSYGAIAYLTMDGVNQSDPLYVTLKNNFIAKADSFKANSESNAYGTPITRFGSVSNMETANAGIFMGLAYQLTGDSSYVAAVDSSASYLLGSNPLAMCFVTGYGTMSPQNPYHRVSAAVGAPVKGMLVGGVNQNLEDGIAMSFLYSVPNAKRYIDERESYSTNEAAIYTNSSFICMLALADSAANEDHNIMPMTNNDVPAVTTTAVTDINVADETTTETTTAVTANVKRSISPRYNAYGDVNCDGNITLNDLVYLNKYVAKIIKFNDVQRSNADCVCDGSINSADVAALTAFLGERIDSLPVIPY